MVGFAEELENPEFDCSCTFGKEHFYLFHPLAIRSFTIQIWTRDKSAAQGNGNTWSRSSKYTSKENVLYAVSVFEDGEKISSRDARFRASAWLQKLIKGWQQEVFTREEINSILEDLYQLKPN